MRYKLYFDGSCKYKKIVPERIPKDWVVNPHNNPDKERIKHEMLYGKEHFIRENWISPQALQKLCSKIGCYKDNQTAHELYSLNNLGIGIMILDSKNNVVFEQGQKQHNLYGTHNVAEYEALSRGLDVLSVKRPDEISELKIYGDSKLVIEQVSLNWKVKAEHLKKYRDVCVAQIKLYEKEGCRVSLEWIPREQNKLADKLAQDAADGDNRYSNQLHDETDIWKMAG